MKKLKISKRAIRGVFDHVFNKPQTSNALTTTKTVVLVRPTTQTIVKPLIVTKTVVNPTTVVKPTTVTKTVTKTRTHTPIYTHTSVHTPIHTSVHTFPLPTHTITTTINPTQTNTGGNAIVNAINRVFGLNLGENVEQHSCAARHAASEPTIAYAHTVWRTGDRCQGGIGAVWSSSPNPDMAARMWLNSPPHASIIRGARRLACGSGPSSAVCIAYN